MKMRFLAAVVAITSGLVLTWSSGCSSQRDTPDAAEKAPEGSGVLARGEIGAIAQVARELSNNSEWLTPTVIDALGRRRVELDEVFPSAPRFVQVRGVLYRIFLRGMLDWSGFDAKTDDVYIYMTREVFNELPEGGNIAFRRGVEQTLVDGQLPKGRMIALSVGALDPTEGPDLDDRVAVHGQTRIALGAPATALAVLRRDVPRDGAPFATALDKNFLEKPWTCNGANTPICPNGYDPWFILTDLRMEEDHEPFTNGSPEIELYIGNIDVVGGVGGQTATTTVIFDGRNTTDKAGRPRFLPDVGNQAQWYAVGNGFALFPFSLGTRWSAMLVEDDDTKGALIARGDRLITTNTYQYNGGPYGITQRTIDTFRAMRLGPPGTPLVDIINQILANGDDVFYPAWGVTPQGYIKDICQGGRPYNTRITVGSTSNEWSMKGYYACLPGTCYGTCGAGCNGTLCREAENSCDVQEFCTNGVCPADAKKANGTFCTDTTPGNCYSAKCSNGVCNQTAAQAPNGTNCTDTTPSDCYTAACSSGSCLQTYCYHCACFAGGTSVTMADGSRRPVETIRVGEKVLSYDAQTGVTLPAEVEQTFVHDKPADGMVVINGTLQATAGHPFWVQGRWVPASELTIGDKLTVLPKRGGVRLAAAGDSVIAVRTLESVPSSGKVYNLEVKGAHNYFAAGVLVHNKPQLCDLQ
jgi:hypothetical protein